MIGKQSIGRGFRGTLGYVLGKEYAERIGGNMLGESVPELSAEFSESRKLKPNLQRAVYHTSLSAAPGERLSNEQWNQVTEKYLQGMGFQHSQYVVVRHQDTEIDHVHIVASRIGLNGKVVSDSKNYQRSEAILRGIEREYGLKPVTPSHEVERRAPTRGELEMAGKGIASMKLRLQVHLDEVLASKPATLTELLHSLQERGVSAVPNVAKTGHVSGISFVLNGEQMKGSDLGRRYTWASLQRQGVSYERNRDFPFLQGGTGQAIGQAVEPKGPSRNERSGAMGKDDGQHRAPEEVRGVVRSAQPSGSIDVGLDHAVSGFARKPGPETQGARESCGIQSSENERSQHGDRRKDSLEDVGRPYFGTGAHGSRHFRDLLRLAVKAVQSSPRSRDSSARDAEKDPLADPNFKKAIDQLFGINEKFTEAEEIQREQERELSRKQRELERGEQRKLGRGFGRGL